MGKESIVEGRKGYGGDRESCDVKIGVREAENMT